MRHAIWLVHNRRCAYCYEPVPFSDLSVDHVIPQTLSNKPELAEVLNVLGLPEDFDLFSIENLLPAHHHCNRAKSADIFDPHSIEFLLRRAASASVNIRRMVAAKRKEYDKDDLLKMIGEAFNSGIISPMELQTPTNPNVLRLTKPLVFADAPDEPVHAIMPEEVESYLDRPILVGGNPGFSTNFGDDTGVRMTVRTCREYRAALDANFYPQTNYDIKSEAFLKTANSVLTAASSLRRAHISYIHDPHRGVADLDLLPATLLPAISPDDQEQLNQWKDLSVQNLVERGVVKILRVSSTEISLEWSMGFMIRELCRADIDGDGIEDLLCECYSWAIGGTLGFGSTCVLSRTDENGRFSCRS